MFGFKTLDPGGDTNLPEKHEQTNSQKKALTEHSEGLGYAPSYKVSWNSTTAGFWTDFRKMMEQFETRVASVQF